MTFLTVGLWACSGTLIGLLAIFSMQNKKSGWKKSRATLSEALGEFYADLGLMSAPGSSEETTTTQNTSRVTSAPVAPDVNGFSRQLANLKVSLGESSRAPVEHAAPATPELVAVQVRR